MFCLNRFAPVFVPVLLSLLNGPLAQARDRQISTVIFDLGGVVVGNSAVSGDELVATLLQVPIEQIQKDLPDVFAPVTIGRMSEEEALSAYAEKMGKSLPPDWRAQFIAQYLDTAPVRPAMVHLVRCLQENGYKTPLLSDTGPIQAGVNRGRGAYDLFDPLMLSHEIGRKKPDVSTFKYALEVLGVPATQTVFVDDRQANVDGANAAGMFGIRFRDVPRLVDELACMGIQYDCAIAP